jgi:hypothetical protein
MSVPTMNVPSPNVDRLVVTADRSGDQIPQRLESKATSVSAIVTTACPVMLSFARMSENDPPRPDRCDSQRRC